MRVIDKARIIAKEYTANKAELARLLEEQERPYTPSAVPVNSGRISKPVEAAVLGKLSSERIQYLQQAVGAVECALEVVVYKNEGNITKQLFEMVYQKKTHELYGAAMVVNISYTTAKRYNKFLLKMIAIHMGYISEV